MAMHLCLNLTEQGTVAALLWHTLHIKVVTRKHSLVGKMQERTIWVERKQNMYKSSVSSMSLITMQTEQMCYCLQFTVYLYFLAVDETEGAC